MVDEKHMSYSQQVEIFEKRGMQIDSNSEKHLKKISYYKLKRIAKFFYDTNEKKYKPNTHFNAVLANFYYDMNLRMELLKLCEIIELSIKNKFSFILGKKYGWNGYLKFSNWCNRDINKKELIYYEDKFKTHLKKNIKKKQNNPIISDFYKENKNEKFPSIWRIVEILTFGEMLNLIKLMSKNNKINFANFYGMNFDILISHLENINLIRNFCAHNNPVIDITLKTIPKKIKDFDKLIIKDRKLMISILIIVNLVKIIEKEYDFSKLNIIINQLIKTDNVAQKYGAINKKNIFEFINK